MILAEMEKHEDAWPFLVPVNPKQVITLAVSFNFKLLSELPVVGFRAH